MLTRYRVFRLKEDKSEFWTFWSLTCQVLIHINNTESQTTVSLQVQIIKWAKETVVRTALVRLSLVMAFLQLRNVNGISQFPYLSPLVQGKRKRVQRSICLQAQATVPSRTQVRFALVKDFCFLNYLFSAKINYAQMFCLVSIL